MTSEAGEGLKAMSALPPDLTRAIDKFGVAAGRLRGNLGSPEEYAEAHAALEFAILAYGEREQGLRTAAQALLEQSGFTPAMQAEFAADRRNDHMGWSMMAQIGTLVALRSALGKEGEG